MRLALISMLMIPLAVGCATASEACENECEDEYEQCKEQVDGDSTSVCSAKQEKCKKACPEEDNSGGCADNSGEGCRSDTDEPDAIIRTGSKISVWVFMVLGLIRRRYKRY